MHLIWFRNDLRLSDQPAITAAVARANQEDCPLLALFILCPEQDRLHHRAPSQSQFMQANIVDLVRRLKKLNIQSIIKMVPTYADVPELILGLVKTYQIRRLFFNREYLINECQRDRDVINIIESYDTRVCVSEPAYLLPPKSIEKQSGGMYHVFTPYKREFIKMLKTNYQPPLAMPEAVNSALKQEFEDVSKLDGIDNGWHHDWWPVGERSARGRLSAFIANEDYRQQRDYPAINGTSRLSPYLALGVLSARQCLAQALKQQGESAFESTWVSELIWREFYHDLVAFYPRLVKHKTFKTDAMDDWHYDEDIVQAWKSGHTGFPIIDAGMRQLKQEHWMHNRVRMLTASFLTKLCLHDWRIGEQHFMEHLIDGDFASNNGGWQWSSATGCDVAPYFRIFNPTTQSQKFDEQGEYIRQYVPELKELSNKEIHNPGEQQRRDCDYPAPIIDYKHARAQALNWFKSG